MLGKLVKIDDLRSIWKNEALDFTNWLSKEENLAILGDEIGIDISLIQTEASVGRYNVDILAEEESSGRKIVIENQLEVTDHDHLGKLITYASGYDAQIIIWLVKDVRDEHKNAIDWLNKNTDENLNFFIIKIELWKIDMSSPAVKFEVISRPNDWARNIKKLANRSDLSQTKLLQLEFWNGFKDYDINNGKKLKLRKIAPENWLDCSYGVSKSHICFTINTIKNHITCEVYVVGSKALYNQFFDNKELIEEELNMKLEWCELPDNKVSRIKNIRSCNLYDTKEWQNHFKWLRDTAIKLEDVFYKYRLN